jgi:hypothetical protein
VTEEEAEPQQGEEGEEEEGEGEELPEEDPEAEDDETPSATKPSRPRPKLKASNSGADIMLGLETDEGQSAEVEIDTADQELSELMPEGASCPGLIPMCPHGSYRVSYQLRVSRLLAFFFTQILLTS